jgi:hypothetical protein
MIAMISLQLDIGLRTVEKVIIATRHATLHCQLLSI